MTREACGISFLQRACSSSNRVKILSVDKEIKRE